MRVAKKVFAVLAAVFGLLAAAMYALPRLLFARAEASSIGIIGEADGPTAIFVASPWPNLPTIATILAVLCGVTALVMHFDGKKGEKKKQ